MGGAGRVTRTRVLEDWQVVLLSVCDYDVWIICVDGRVHVSVYCARRIPAHFMGTQFLILLHLINICYLTYICLWQISQIQTCLRVGVGPGFVSTSPAFMRRCAIQKVRMADLLKMR